MTPDKLEQLKGLVERATPGPWTTRRTIPAHHDFLEVWQIDSESDAVCTTQFCYGPENEANAAFIAEARTALPELLAEIEGLTAERDEVLKFTECVSLSQLAGAFMTAQANWDLTLDRAEAAEAEIEGLRGALERIKDLGHQPLRIGEIARQALSPSPPEVPS